MDKFVKLSEVESVSEPLESANVLIEEDGVIKRTPKSAVGGTKGSGIDVTGATVGQIVRISEVDNEGKPTAWEPVDGFSGSWDDLTDRPFYTQPTYEEVQILAHSNKVKDDYNEEGWRDVPIGTVNVELWEELYEYDEVAVVVGNLYGEDSITYRYDCTVQTEPYFYDDWVGYIGNPYLIDESYEDNGMKFVLYNRGGDDEEWYHGDQWILICPEFGYVSVSLNKKISERIYCLDRKYLPLPPTDTYVSNVPNESTLEVLSSRFNELLEALRTSGCIASSYDYID